MDKIRLVEWMKENWRRSDMQKWLPNFLKQESTIPCPLYSLERENELLHDVERILEYDGLAEFEE